LSLKKIAVLMLLVTGAAVAIPILTVSPPGPAGSGIDRDEFGGPEIKVFIAAEGVTVSMPLEKYLVGVVAAEMPAEFHIEALKAQAVAARTYALRKMHRGDAPGDLHPGADVCTDHNHCQAWISDGEMERRWGPLNALKYREKILAAVMGTRGQVLTYRGDLIEPVYHSTSNGRTENSEDAWQYEVPYLRSVASRWDKESPRYRNVVEFTLEEVDRRLGTTLNALPAGGLPGSAPVRVREYTGTGRTRTVEIGGKVFTGRELREKLGLPSTDFTCEVEDGKIVFITRGNGHGVGMSQYGANGMAKEGYNYVEILKHYYTGVTLARAYD